MDRKRVATQSCICIDHYLSKLFCTCIAQSDSFNQNRVGPNEVTCEAVYYKSDKYFSLRGKSPKIIQPSNLFNQSNYLACFENCNSKTSYQPNLFGFEQQKHFINLFYLHLDSSLVLCARQLPKSLSIKYRLGLSRYKLIESIITTNVLSLCPPTPTYH